MMARVHWVPENEQPSQKTLAGEKIWKWCQQNLRDLRYLAPLDCSPALARQKSEGRAELAPFRGAQYVLVELDQDEAGDRAGYYFSSTSPQDLDRRLRNDLPTEIRRRLTDGRLPRMPLFGAGRGRTELGAVRASQGEMCDACGGYIHPTQSVCSVVHPRGQAALHEHCFDIWQEVSAAS